MTVGYGIIAMFGNSGRRIELLEIGFGEQEGERFVLPQAALQVVERLLPLERRADLLRRLLQLARELVEVLRQVLLAGLDLLLLRDGLEQQITFHFEQRTLAQLVAHAVQVEPELAWVDAAAHEALQHGLNLD